MFEGFLRNTFDLGLSTVEADDPDTSEGVRAKGVSNLAILEEAASDAVIAAAAVFCFRASFPVAAFGIPPFCVCAPLDVDALSVLWLGRFFVSFEGEWCIGTLDWG